MPSDNPPPTSIDELATRLHAAAIHLLRTLRREDDAAGLTAPRLSVLSVLVFGGSQSIGTLAAAEQVAAPTMTRLIAGLEMDGLVERTRDTEDRRSVRITATDRATRLLLEGRSRRVSRLVEILGALGAADREALERAVLIVETSLERVNKPPGQAQHTR